MTTYAAPRGPVPKPPAQRRRRNKPAPGAAKPVVVSPPDEQPALGFDAHQLVADLWTALGQSVEGQFFSTADWARARLEMWYVNAVMTSGQVPSAHQWSAVQRGLDELLVSPAVKRRAGIELKKCVDGDAVAADEIVGRYKRTLKSV